MQVPEVIRRHLGWCPVGRTPIVKHHAGSPEKSETLVPGQPGSSDDGIPRVHGSERYRNARFSTFFTSAMIVAVIMSTYNILMYQSVIPSILFALVVIMSWLVAASLTVTLHDDVLEITKGPLAIGLNHRNVFLAEIVSVCVEKKPKNRAIWFFLSTGSSGKPNMGNH